MDVSWDDAEYTKLTETCLMAIYAVLLIVSIVLVIRRRRLQPLRFRDPYLLIATVVSTFVANCTIVSSFYEIGSVSCALQILSNLPFLSMIVFLCARFWKLLLASEITQARLAGRAASSWILRHPWLLSSQAIWRASVALIAALFLVHVGLVLASPDCGDSAALRVLFLALLMAYWLAVAVMTWQLRRIQDGFFVVGELRMLGAVLLITNVIIIMGKGHAAVPIAISSILQLIIQIWYPIWKSYRMAQVKARQALTELASQASLYSEATVVRTRSKAADTSTVLTADSTFLDLLRHPDGFAAMRQFLTLEFSVENILCWKELHERKRERRPDQVEAHFRHVYEAFIGKGCLSEVNINSQLKRHFQSVYSGLPADVDEILKMKPAKMPPGSVPPDPDTDIKLRLLKALYLEMVQLMQMDSYQRFKLTVEYQKLLQLNPEHRTAMMRE